MGIQLFLFDVVATQDTVTQLSSAIRKLLRALDRDCRAFGGALVRDAHAALEALEGNKLEGPAADAAELVAIVAGQDIDHGDRGGSCKGAFRIARRVAPIG